VSAERTSTQATIGLVLVWRFLDGSGADTGSSPAFADQAQAEAWLGASWEELRERGVQVVELLDEGGDEPRYRMSLADE
jgi:hypothetical protein